jgi:epoxyqueuosine reductase
MVGFADVSCLPAGITAGFTSAVSVAVALKPAVIRDMKNGPTYRYFAEYERVNALLTRLCDHGAEILAAAGYRAEPVKATTEHFDPATLAVRVQHKTIATRAGLGWIGKSALLVTKEYGSAIRLGSVLTDARLAAGAPTDTSHCGNCRECVDRCPARAIVGDNWQPGMPRASIYDAAACRATARRLSDQVGIEPTICGICINACPWTQRYLVRMLKQQPIEIAPVNVDEFATARALFREYEANLPFDLSFQHFQQEADTLPGQYAPPTGQLLMARCEGQGVGCVALRQIGDGLCEMKRLFVQPAFQGRGIGRALAEAIIEEARRIGYKRMWLDTVLEPAKCLYQSLGFAEIPPYQHVPIEGVVFMELAL